jgi:hypothetical protein
MCSTIFSASSEFSFEIKDNEHYDYTTGKCQEYEKLCQTTINISAFDISKPYGNGGKLYYPDLVVIPDESFTILLNYPFIDPVETTVTLTTKITLREILSLIKQIYYYIYEEEERTADATEFAINRPCTDCSDKDLKQILNEMVVDKGGGTESECSICYMPFEQQNVVLKCKHIFHDNCLYNWIDKGKGHSCPLCRLPFNQCDACDNTKMIRSVEEHVVLPSHLRYPTGLRNTTNGMFGIYGYDLESLSITEMWYNRTNRLLQVIVQV